MNQATNGQGTVTTNGTTTLTGSNTLFTNTFKVGDTITVLGETRTISTIASDTTLTVTSAFTTSQSGQSYTLTGGTRFVVLGNGNVGIETTSSQGALDVNTTTGAFIVPRMTTTQRDALTPVNGMIIYNNTTNQFNFRENGAWVTN